MSLTTTTSLSSRKMRLVTLAWTSSGGGSVSSTFDIGGGYIHSVEVVPGSGADQPTDQYDVTITNSNGIDILSGRGANQSSSAGAIYQMNPPLFHRGDTMTLTVSNAGAANTGTVLIHIL